MVDEHWQQMFLTSPRSVNTLSAAGSAMPIFSHLGTAKNTIGCMNLKSQKLSEIAKFFLHHLLRTILLQNL